MSELTKNIFDIKKSKSYSDYNKYHVGNILGITKVSRWELMHSNFIAWLFNTSGSHSLHTFPLLQLIIGIEFLKDKPDNVKARVDMDVIRKFYDHDFLISAEVEREIEHIDIHILVKTKEKILPILIENKVDSKENGKHGDQTNQYFEWGEEQYKDKNKYYSPIYLFLLPEYNSKVIQKNENYLRITYQELVDYVIEPSLYMCGDGESQNNIKIYLQCLSYQSDNEKGEYSMAISSEEKKILDDFIKENKNLLCSVLRELDDEVDSSALEKITKSVRDYSTYSFDGNEYTKARLVLAVVKKYVAEKNPASYADLTSVFMDHIQGSKGVVKREGNVTDKDKGIGGQKRYFVDDPIVLSSGETILVCSQWDADNIGKLIDVAKKVGYSIVKA